MEKQPEKKKKQRRWETQNHCRDPFFFSEPKKNTQKTGKDKTETGPALNQTVS